MGKLTLNCGKGVDNELEKTSTVQQPQLPGCDYPLVPVALHFASSWHEVAEVLTSGQPDLGHQRQGEKESWREGRHRGNYRHDQVEFYWDSDSFMA